MKRRNRTKPLTMPPGLQTLLTTGTWLLLAMGPARAAIPGHRYVWGELPFTFVTPERVIEGKTTCISNNYNSNDQSHKHHPQFNTQFTPNTQYNQNSPRNNSWQQPQTSFNPNTLPQHQANSTITTCTTTPARVIPSSSTTRLLQVQYDCTDQTYDAKRDGKAWRNVRAGYGDGVYDHYKRVCQNENDTEQSGHQDGRSF
jgi:hypothetical protein